VAQVCRLRVFFCSMMNPGRSNCAFDGGRDQGVHLEGEQLGGLHGFCVDQPDAVGVVAVLAKTRVC